MMHSMPTQAAVAHGDEDCDNKIARWGDRIEIALARALPDPLAEPVRLHAAMLYAVLGNGKRMRPSLVYATGCALGAREEALDAPAVAVELVHAYSLVHDDLPAMDDDALRRGRATVHVAFDEATAILTGDALQALAFEVLADAALPADLRVELISTLARASGTSGMCGGQALDLASTGVLNAGLADVDRAPAGSVAAGNITIDALETMHAQKTGALIRAAVRMGALCAHADAGTLSRLDDYAAALGLAFQIRDDILDVEGNSAELGKTAGKDAAQSKSTYPSLLGMIESRRRLDELGTRMRELLQPFGGMASPLASLAARAVQRTR
jgi:farnesyl diphosphate synthase